VCVCVCKKESTGEKENVAVGRERLITHERTDFVEIEILIHIWQFYSRP